MLHRTQLSFVQLAGGIAVGIQGKQPKYNVTSNKLHVSQTVSLSVRTTTLRVCSQLSNDITSQVWFVGSVLCDIMIAICMTYYVGFSKFLPLDFGEPLNQYSLFTMAAFAIRYHNQRNSINFKEIYPPDDRDRIIDRYILC